jgi:hypothetical protein
MMQYSVSTPPCFVSVAGTLVFQHSGLVSAGIQVRVIGCIDKRYHSLTNVRLW